MPGVAVRPIGSGSPPTAVSQASPPSWSFTSFGALSIHFDARWFFQMSGGSRMWQSASTSMRACLTIRADALPTLTRMSVSHRAGLSGLAALHVVELGGEAAARAGRVLADLGARVTRVSPAGRADVLATRRAAWLAWTYGKQVLTLDDAA